MSALKGLKLQGTDGQSLCRAKKTLDSNQQAFMELPLPLSLGFSLASSHFCPLVTPSMGSKSEAGGGGGSLHYFLANFQQWVGSVWRITSHLPDPASLPVTWWLEEDGSTFRFALKGQHFKSKPSLVQFLSLFRLLKGNTVDWVADKQKWFLAVLEAGMSKMSTLADLVFDDGPFPNWHLFSLSSHGRRGQGSFLRPLCVVF